MKGSGYGLQKFRDPQNELELVYFGCLGYLRRKVLLVIFVGLSESEVFSVPFCVKQLGDTSKSYGEIQKF